MANLIKLRKGLDIKLEGAAIETKVEIGKAKEYARHGCRFASSRCSVVHWP